MSETLAHEANAEQVVYWNGRGGRHWTERQESQDRLLAPISRILIGAAEIKSGERVIDVGCGCGDTTLTATALAGPGGHALGVDISEPMIARAVARARETGSAAEFALADATVRDFAGEAADIVISRFGVMFFADPALSFANLRGGLKPGGRVAFVCWREPKLNPWLVLPFQAMKHRVPPQPQLGPEDPGPFSFADEARVRRILGAAGFSDVSLAPSDLELDTANGGGLDAAVETALEIGPASRALDGVSEDVRAGAAADIRAALAPFQRGESVWLGAAIWIVKANA